MENQLLVKGFDLDAKSLTNIVDFFKCFETAKEIFNGRGDALQPNKKPKQSGDRNQPASLAEIKVSNQTVKPSEEDAQIKSK